MTILRGPNLDRAIRGLAGQLKPDQQIIPRLVQGTVLDWDLSSFLCTVTLHGDPDTVLEGIPYNPLGYVPKTDDTVWLMRFGPDLWIWGQSSTNMFNNPQLGRLPCAELRSGSAIVIPAAFVYTKLAFDFKAFDSNTFTSGGSPWDTFTCIIAGLYQVEVEVMWNDASTVPVDRGLALGDATLAAVYSEEIVQYETGTGTHLQGQQLSRTIQFAEGQQVCGWAAQGGGGGLAINPNQYAGPRLNIVRVGPPP